MTKKIKVITIQQNQVLEIPSDTIEVEAQEDNEEHSVIVDNTENQVLPLDVEEVVEPQDVKPDLTEPIVKVKKPRVKKEKVISAPIVEESVIVKPDEIETTRPIEISDVLNVKPELTQREVKVMHLVKCEKCNRKMLEQTLKYKHQESCPGNKTKQPKQPKTKEINLEPIADIEDINLEPPQILPLKRSPTQCSSTVRQTKINQKKEQFKALFANAS